MHIDFSPALSFFFAVIAIINPIGNLPMFLEAVNEDPVEVQKTVAKLLGLTIFVICAFFYFTGQPFLKMFGITIPAFRIAGGILLMMIGMRLMNGKPKFDNDGLAKKPTAQNPFKEAKARLSSIIVPVAIPLFVGPGVLTTVILFSQQATGFVANFLMLLALAAVCGVIAFVLYMSRRLVRIFGNNGMQIITRVFGLILCAMAVQFVIDGAAQLLPGAINPLYMHVE
ncbi:MAG: MarC family protein [Elusimicrobiota bacterium]|jgi:multiple antibiotic resistance protein|nr:MarC family protein [Elusimicrobiota bacterium]